MGTRLTKVVVITTIYAKKLQPISGRTDHAESSLELKGAFGYRSKCYK